MSGQEEKRIGDLKEIEAALASLVPRGDRLDRDRLMFLAGQASVVRRGPDGAARAGRWAWPSAFAAASAVAASLLVALAMRWGPGSDNRVAQVPSPPQPTTAGLQPPAPSPTVTFQAASPRWPPARDAYHQLLARVLDRGLDAWRTPAGNGGTMTGAAPATYREMLGTLLESPPT